MKPEKALHTVLVVLLASLLVLIVFIWVGAWQHMSSMSEMMRRMMGSGALMQWWLGPTLISVIILIVFVVAVYVILLNKPAPSHSSTEPYQALPALTAEEWAVVELLVQSGGQALQKDIARELNLSRLKVHRLVSSLRKRGVVTVEPRGNTNLVRLSQPVGRDAS